jgi:hypothetical protein
MGIAYNRAHNIVYQSPSESTLCCDSSQSCSATPSTNAIKLPTAISCFTDILCYFHFLGAGLYGGLFASLGELGQEPSLYAPQDIRAFDTHMQ